MSAKQTASELYTERREDIARLIDWLDLELGKHQAKAEAEPADWSYAGDLGQVREKLIQTLAFLANQEPEEIEHLLGDSGAGHLADWQATGRPNTSNTKEQETAMKDATISISICPTRLEFDNGDCMDEEAYLAAIRQAVHERWPDARIDTLQVGYSQGDDWATVDGRESDELTEVIDSIDTSDPSLF